MNLTLTTDRLRLQPLGDSDLDLAIALWTDPEVAGFNGGVATEAEIRAEFPLTLRRGGGGVIGIWSVTDAETGEKIGSSYLLPLPVDSDDVDYKGLDLEMMPTGDIEVGYFLKPSAWGQGYATEVCQRLLSLAFEETALDELVAAVHADNVASRAVLSKCGFRDTGPAACWGSTFPLYRIAREAWSSLQ